MKTTIKPAPVRTLKKNSVPIDQLGFDFDGVIADTATTFLKIAENQYGYNSLTKEDITNFELEECIDIPKDIVERIFTDILTDSLGTGLQPMEGAVSTLSQFARHARLTIITARPIDQPVHDWLETYFDKSLLGNIRVIATGDHNDKIRHIHANGIQFFVDDRVATCQSLVTENICPIVYNQPWNAGRHNLSMVSDWSDISKLVNLPR